jgi:hypothetical protein
MGCTPRCYPGLKPIIQPGETFFTPVDRVALATLSTASAWYWHLNLRRIPDLSHFSPGRFARGVLLLGIVVFTLTTVVYASVARLETNDSFCASCHVEPETTYYQASLKPAEATTLAAFHAGEGTRCIDCHSRRWVPGRIWAQLGGLQNFLAFRSGKHTNPAVTTRPVGDGGCSKCHGDLTWVSERPGHYHSPGLRRRWRAANGPANTCEACHSSHEAIAPASDHFMEAEQIEIQCDACHDLTGAVSDSSTEAAIIGINTIGLDYFFRKPWDPPCGAIPSCSKRMFPVYPPLVMYARGWSDV